MHSSSLSIVFMVHGDFPPFIFVLNTKCVFYWYCSWHVFLESIVSISGFHCSIVPLAFNIFADTLGVTTYLFLFMQYMSYLFLIC